jgi:hypothetical protein
VSALLSGVRTRVRYYLNDLDASQPVFTDPRLNMAISTARVIVAGETHMPHAWSNADFTTSTSTDTYAITGTALVEQVLALVNAEDGLEIEMISRKSFQALRDGIDDPQHSGSGQPLFATLIESVTNVLSVQLHPWPDAAYRVNVLRAVLSPDAVHTDSTSLAFDAHGIEAVAARAAAHMAGKADQATLAKLGLSPNAAQDFERLAMMSESHTRVRRRRLSAVGHTRHDRRW